MSTPRQVQAGATRERWTRTALARLRRAPYLPRHRDDRSIPGISPDGCATMAWLRSPRSFVLWLIVAGTIGRLILAHVIGLGVDESYQVSVSRPLSLSYFEHPPLAFWIPGVIGALAGSGHRVLLRLPFILAFAGTTWMMYRLGARLFGERAGALAALILNLSPVFSLSTGGWVLPDGPLVFWMLAATLCLERVLVPREPSAGDVHDSLGWWIGAGACAGLALLSKYHGVFMLAGVGLFLLTHHDARRWLRHPGPYLGAAIMLALFSPVLIWNAEHQWVSFRFQGGRGAAHHGLHLVPFLQNIAGQLGYLLPWICIPLAWVLAAALIAGVRAALRSPERVPASDRRRYDTARWFLACLAIGPIATFTLISLNGSRGLPHWSSPGWLMAIPLLAAAVDARLVHGAPAARRHTRQWLLGSAVVFVVLVPVAAMQASTGWMERAAPTLFAHGDPTVESLDWSDLPAAIEPALRARHGERPFVAVTSWIDGGKTAYALGDRADVVCLCTEPHHFAFIHDARSYAARDAVIVERAGKNPSAATTLSRYFRSVEPMGSTVLRRAGQPAITLMLYRGEALTPIVAVRDH